MPLREVKYNWKEEAIYFFERQGYKISYKAIRNMYLRPVHNSAISYLSIRRK